MPEAAELCYLSAAALGRLYRQGEVSPVEVTQAVLERIQRHDDHLRCYITVTADSALQEARRAEAELRQGVDRGPLQGVPVAVKDLYDTAGVRTTYGAKLFAEHVPTRDADAVERLKRGGAVLLGKANLHEIAYGVTSTNPHFGTCRNPWNTERVPGGSSGGSAAAVAAGMAHLALGTDTGGSIRIPASYCGIVGLKPTYGLLSRHGIRPDVWDLDHSGPYGRDARDTALLLGALAGHDPRDPASARVPIPDYLAELERDVRGLRVGLLRQQVDPAVPEVREAVLAAARTLEGLGMRVEEVTLPHEAASMPASTAVLFAAMSSHYLPLLREYADDFGADVRERLELGVLIPGTAFVKGQRVRTLLLRECLQVLERVDVLLCGATPVPAPKVGELPPIPAVRFSRLWNMMGLPALVTPCAMTADGLPIGLQIVGRAFEDGLTLRVAHAYAQATGTPDYARKRPQLDAA